METLAEPRTLTVGAVARLAGVTVRTLHHYHQIGLLRPSGRSDAGYRRYAEADLERLQRILFYRELGLGLDQISEAMTDGEADASAHLRQQHAMLMDRIGKLQRMASAVEKALEARTMGISLTPEERFEVFGDHDPDRYAAEVEERWGETDAYRESMRRTKAYTRADWRRIRDEGQAAVDQLVAAMQAGKLATSEEAMDGAELHRLQIDRNFYPVSYQMHVGLAKMYLADPRFTATYEKVAPGLAQYLHDAIRANAARPR
ncbi:MAG TPA: MerR family transcriptional regulator [Candidatus Limnocylindrales bacterium]|nr:MerR family transcriptional regulator [Candidatus Limnocylindrales bacterium]